MAPQSPGPQDPHDGGGQPSAARLPQEAVKAPPGALALPENARRPLREGEEYIPIVPAESDIKEVTRRSVVLGLIMCAVFSMAAAYLALKVGQGIEAAIPISILAIGVSRLFARKSTILENVIIQSIGANSSHVVSGAVFTIPALYMLGMNPTWYQVVLTAFLGGCLGILFLIPLRHYFMVELHGQLPWPEGTATTEILVSGESVGEQAKVLVGAAALGAAYDAMVTTFHAWSEVITFRSVYLGSWLQERFMTLRVLNVSAVVGIGYIVGLKYAAIICAGSFLSYFVLIPMVHAIGAHVPDILPPGTKPIGDMTIREVFVAYVKIVGIGGIAGAGIMGVVSSFPSMVKSVRTGLKGLGHQGQAKGGQVKRTDRSLSMGFTAVAIVAVGLAIMLFFSYGMEGRSTLVAAAVGVVLALVISFLFAPVAARAIAIIGTNPVSGMTMLTLIITGFIMLKLGLKGEAGMFVVMLVGGVVCTALCASGALSTDLKIGHWLGATPRSQLLLKFLGTFVAAVFCGLAMWLLAQAPAGQGFGTATLPAPQASAMKEILIGIMGTESAPLQWYLFSLGVVLSLILRMAGVPALAFALGMYLPLELNTPILIGGFLSYLVARKKAGDSDAAVKARVDRGILLASGLMAGGAIMGVLDALINAIIKGATGSIEAKASVHIFSEEALMHGATAEVVAILALVGLSILIVSYSRAAKAGPEA